MTPVTFKPSDAVSRLLNTNHALQLQSSFRLDRGCEELEITIDLFLLFVQESARTARLVSVGRTLTTFFCPIAISA